MEGTEGLGGLKLVVVRLVIQKWIDDFGDEARAAAGWSNYHAKLRSIRAGCPSIRASLSTKVRP
jgi:hypothetical protein